MSQFYGVLICIKFLNVLESLENFCLLTLYQRINVLLAKQVFLAFY